MIRPAKFTDIPRIVELLCEMQAASKYAGLVEVDEKKAHRLIAQCIHRHGHQHDGGSLVMVAVRDSRVEGLMVGILSPVYEIGTKLAASDVFLYCSKKAEATDFLRLFESYVRWASVNPKVFEIKASWTDVSSEAERMEKVYERFGFRRCGAIYERRAEEDVRAAA